MQHLISVATALQIVISVQISRECPYRDISRNFGAYVPTVCPVRDIGRLVAVCILRVLQNQSSVKVAVRWRGWS